MKDNFNNQTIYPHGTNNGFKGLVGLLAVFFVLWGFKYIILWEQEQK